MEQKYLLILNTLIARAKTKHGKIKPIRNIKWSDSYTIESNFFILWYLDKNGSSHIEKEILSDWTCDNEKQIKMINIHREHLEKMYMRSVTNEESAIHYCRFLAKYYKHWR
jgi:hypothetical protein